MLSPAIRLVDVMCELWPEKKEQLMHLATDFYNRREEQMGEYVVAHGLLTEEELKFAILTQKAELGRLSASDSDELMHIRLSVHTRWLASCEEMSIIANGLKAAR